MEHCPITIPLWSILTSSDYGVCNSHYILYCITFVTAGVRDRTANGSGMYMGFCGGKNYNK